jgi:hypothetical protein
MESVGRTFSQMAVWIGEIDPQVNSMRQGIEKVRALAPLILLKLNGFAASTILPLTTLCTYYAC